MKVILDSACPEGQFAWCIPFFHKSAGVELTIDDTVNKNTYAFKGPGEGTARVSLQVKSFPWIIPRFLFVDHGPVSREEIFVYSFAFPKHLAHAQRDLKDYAERVAKWDGWYYHVESAMAKEHRRVMPSQDHSQSVASAGPHYEKS